ncbi:MAG TPA: hypothetical protein VK427_10730 [Kofleriaceae bacterium]|nr:hypothetical protein [Kofleriaceae bacterium]
MPLSRTQLSRFLSSISLVLVAACSDDDGGRCGPDGAPAAGLTATSSDVTLTYGNLSSLSGNDCPASDAPPGVISLSIEGTQVGGTGLVTFCIPRPDLLSAGRTLGTTSSMGQLRVIDFSGQANNCTFALDSTMPPTGTATGTGVCKNGTDPGGFALELAGTITLRRTCGAVVDSVTLMLSGKVAVTSRD